MDLAPSALHRLARRLALAAILRVVLADDLVAEPEQQVPVGARYADDPGHERERERRGDPFDHVELAGTARGNGTVDDIVGEPGDVVTPGAHGLRRESTRD